MLAYGFYVEDEKNQTLIVSLNNISLVTTINKHDFDNLSDWKSKNLSLGGRLVLLKYVLSSLSVYFFSFFKAPASIISSIESIFNCFFFGCCEEVRKISWLTGTPFVPKRRMEA